MHVVIVGAGAAGLFAAGEALKRGHTVTLAEKMQSAGSKLAITGKGRCNLTNNCDAETFLSNIRRNPRFLYSTVSALPPKKLMAVFEEELCVPLKTERGRRVFPQSDDAREVVNALLRRAEGAQMVNGRVTELLIEGPGTAPARAVGVKLADGRRLESDAVLVAAGGLSYPATGSTGDGYALAAQAGHSLVPPQPSLVALAASPAHTALCARLAGLSLRNVGVRLLRGEKSVFAQQGEALFTHFGMSGPVILSASAFLDGADKHRYALALDFKPALPPDVLDARILRDFTAMPNRGAAHCLDKLLPAGLRPVMLERWGVNPACKVNQLTKDARLRLGALIKDFRIELAGKGDLAHAVITGGGVQVKEVNPKTMQSRLLPGLYFAGEVLDVDGYTGGYNLHIAWATAAAAAAALPDAGVSKGER